MTDASPDRSVTGGTESHGVLTMYIASPESSLEKLCEKMLALNEAVLEGFSTVFRPETSSIQTFSVPKDTPLQNLIDRREAVNSHSVTIGDDVESTIIQLRELLEADSDRIDSPVYIPACWYGNTTYSVYLPAGEIEITPDDSQHYRLQKNGDIKNKRPSYEPLEIKIKLLKNEDVVPEYDRPFVYGIKITIGADVFVEGSDIGEINWARLSDAMEYVSDRFDVLEKSFLPFRYDREQWIQDHLFGYDCPSSESLVREYRLDWIQSELVQTATQYEEDGETIFELTSDAAAVLTDELRKRFEVYVDYQREQGNAPQADRLRIVRTDGNPLEATFSHGRLKWVDEHDE